MSAADAFPYVLGVLGILTFIAGQMANLRAIRKEAKESYLQQIALKDKQIEHLEETVRRLEQDGRDKDHDIVKLERERTAMYERFWNRDR